jgi:uncharacterized lipoprotein YmbA
MMAVTLLALAGCASSPRTRFFTLRPVAPSGADRERIATPVEVDAVHLAPTLERRWMIRGENGTAVTISGQDRWAADLGVLCRRVLSQDLAARLAPGMLIAPESPAPPNTRGVVVSIDGFAPRSGGELVLDADWTLVQGVGAEPVLSRSVHLSRAEGASAASEAAAMSALLGRLADRIAGEIARTDASHARASS